MSKMLKTLKKRLKNQRGLTLVELLAVIVILGIIAAIAVPSIGGIVSKAKDDAAVADALQIISAAKLAHAADPTATSWDEGTLGEYLSHSDDDDFEVAVSGNEYSITNHDEAARVLKSAKVSDPILESALIAKTK